MSENFIPAKIVECDLLPTGGSLKEKTSLLNGIVELTYFESIRSPSISLKIHLIDVDGFISTQGITGGEYISLLIDTPDLGKFKITKKHGLMLNGVRNVITNKNGERSDLEFVTVENIINETSRVTKRFDGSVDQIVEELLVSDTKGIQTKKKLDKDSAGNKYTFCGNLRRPIDTIQWLCPKTQRDAKSFGFLFWETLDGYEFKSIDGLLEQSPFKTFEKTESSQPGDFRIFNTQFNQTNDIGMNLRHGMYATKTIYVDIEKGTKEIIDFNIKDVLKKPPVLPNNLQDKPTRLMYRLLDQGAMQKGSKPEEVQKPEELAKTQNKSYAKSNLLFAQSFTIVIPFDPNLRAGQIVKIKMPVSDESGNRTFSTKKEEDFNGEYLVSKLRHTINTKGSSSQLSLIRNVFTT